MQRIAVYTVQQFGVGDKSGQSYANLFLFLIRANCSTYGLSKPGRSARWSSLFNTGSTRKESTNVPSFMGYRCYSVRVLAAWPHFPHCWWPDPHSTGLSCTGPAVQSLYGQPKAHSLI